jgi:hypothetical protein
MNLSHHKLMDHRNLTLVLAWATGMVFLQWSVVDHCRAQSATNGRYDSIVQSGAATPVNGVTMSAFSKVILNRYQIGFESFLNGASGSSDDQAFVRWSPDVPPWIYSGQMNGFLREGTNVGGGATLNMNLANRQLSINDYGDLGFNCNLSGTSGTNNDTGLFQYGTLGGGNFWGGNYLGGTLTELAREGGPAPGGSGGTLQNFGSGILDVQFRGIDNLGNTYFQDVIPDSPGAPNDDWRFFQVGASGISAIGVEGQAAPSGGNYLTFAGYEMNDSGEAIVTGSTSGSNIGNKIWFKDSTRAMTEIVNSVATGGSSTPVGTLKSLSAGVSMLNNPGDVAFVGWTSTGGTGTSDTFIFRTNKTGAPISVMLAEGSAVPDGNGVFDNLVNTTARFNDAGQYASGLTLRGTSGGTSDNTGIYRIDANGTPTRLFREGQAALSGNGFFGDLAGSTQFAMNEGGMVAMMTNYTGTAAGAADNTAIVVTDGIDYFEVAREGMSTAGSTVASIEFSNGVFGHDDTTSGLNFLGQVAYVQRLANNIQSVQLWTPELHYRGGVSSSIGNDFGLHWTLSVRPNSVHDVFIDSATDATVSVGINGMEVRNLQIGGGSGNAVLQVNGQGALNRLEIDGQLDIKSNGSLILGTGAQATTSELTGTGSITGGTNSILYVTELLAPGQSPGPILIDTILSLGVNSVSQFELGGVNPGEFDQVWGLNELWISNGSDLEVSLNEGFLLADGMEFMIFDIQGDLPTMITGQFYSLSEGSLIGNFAGTNLFITYQGGSGNDVVLYTTAVPEPSTLAMLGLAIMGVSLFDRRRKTCIVASVVGGSSRTEKSADSYLKSTADQQVENF